MNSDTLLGCAVSFVLSVGILLLLAARTHSNIICELITKLLEYLLAWSSVWSEELCNFLTAKV